MNELEELAAALRSQGVRVLDRYDRAAALANVREQRNRYAHDERHRWARDFADALHEQVVKDAPSAAHQQAVAGDMLLALTAYLVPLATMNAHPTAIINVLASLAYDLATTGGPRPGQKVVDREGDTWTYVDAGGGLLLAVTDDGSLWTPGEAEKEYGPLKHVEDVHLPEPSEEDR